MFRVRMVVAGEVEMDRGLARFTEGVADWRPIWNVFADTFYSYIKAQFASEGAEALGSKWAQLSDAYAAWKAVHYPGKPILERTGRLLASLSSSKGAGAVYEPKPKSLTIGSTVPYAIFHQKGTEKMPQRKEIVLSEHAKRELMKLAQMYLIQIASSVGLRKGLTPLQLSQLSAARAKYPGWPLPWESKA